ncbi:hypothetical protein QYE76_064126 [Lolium multiflorum]|uniref:Integrase catalytic domain-containing protein n=1 Tax=Lolium multiflorum TaxID=4521 RepID=A0AAD8W7C1_LOLMU|nr:hypothetical protein QYE76_064126 [Lolium multiflorum]
MMLMLEVCEQKDEEELPPPSPATEIVTDHGLPCVDHVDKLCDEGVVEKLRSAPYPRETTDQASEALELVHGDICGPISPATPSGNEYFMLVVDDHSQYMWIVLLKSKDQAIQAFEKIKEAGEVKARAKKSLRIDRGGELKHTVVAMARSMMESKGLPGKFWGEAVNTAVYLLNRAPTRSMMINTEMRVHRQAWQRLEAGVVIEGAAAHALAQPSQATEVQGAGAQRQQCSIRAPRRTPAAVEVHLVARQRAQQQPQRERRSGSPHGSTPSSSGGAQSRPVGRDVAAASSSSGAAPPHEAGPRRGLSAGRDPSGASSKTSCQGKLIQRR